jgi:hypothetical protein
MNNGAIITKADGSTEPFSERKLLQSLSRAGASKDIQSRIVMQVESELKNGMTTEEIYRHAYELLNREGTHPAAARYSIKRAVLELGPSGFPFEQFVAEVLKAHGWKTKTDVSMTGRCAPHEVDVLATKGSVRAGIEVKFHNHAGLRTDVKDALYVHARFEDLKVSPYKESKVTEGWLVTNTRFTRTAIRYGQCAGLSMLGWDYPRGRGLLELIEEAGVHPLTCLTTLTQAEKQRFLDKKVVLCKEIRSAQSLHDHGIAPSKIGTVLAEAAQVCVLPDEEDLHQLSVDSGVRGLHHVG